MSAEPIPVYIENMYEGIENGAWMHQDSDIATRIVSRAYTSDLGILRLRVSDLHRAAAILKESGFNVKQKSGVIEVVPAGTQDFSEVAHLLQDKGMSVESTAIIPGIYQG